MREFKIFLMAVLLLSVAVGCSKGPRPNVDPDEYVGTDQFTSDVDAMIDFVVNVDYLKLAYMEMTSNGFNQSLLTGRVDYITREMALDYYAHLEHISEHADEYLQAAANLEGTDVLESPETKSITAMTIIGAVGTVSLLKATYEFVDWMSESEDNGVKNIMTTMKRLSPEDQESAVRCLPASYGIKDYKDLMHKLSNRELGRKSKTIHAFLQSDPAYQDAAQDADTDIGSVITREGVVGIDRGTKLALECLGNASAGGAEMGWGVTLAERELKGIEATEKMVKITKEAVDVAADEAGSVAEELYNWFTNDDMETIVQENEQMLHMNNAMIQKKMAAGTGQVNVKDENKGTGDTGRQLRVVIAQPKKESAQQQTPSLTPSNIIGVSESETGEVPLFLPEGEWTVTMVDEDGKKETKNVEVKSGEVQDVNMKPKGGQDGSSSSDPASVTNAEREFGLVVDQISFLIDYNMDASLSIVGKDETEDTGFTGSFQFGDMEKPQYSIEKSVELNKLIYKIHLNDEEFIFTGGDEVLSEKVSGTMVLEFDQHTREMLSCRIKIDEGYEGFSMKYDFRMENVEWNDVSTSSMYMYNESFDGDYDGSISKYYQKHNVASSFTAYDRLGGDDYYYDVTLSQKNSSSLMFYVFLGPPPGF